MVAVRCDNEARALRAGRRVQNRNRPELFDRRAVHKRRRAEIVQQSTNGGVVGVRGNVLRLLGERAAAHLPARQPCYGEMAARIEPTHAVLFELANQIAGRRSTLLQQTTAVYPTASFVSRWPVLTQR